jgi:hypothetical protein
LEIRQKQKRGQYMLRLKSVVAAAALSGLVYAGTASAAFITGSVSLSDGFAQGNIGTGASVVSDLDTVVTGANGSANGCSGAFAGGADCATTTFSTGTIVLSAPPNASIFTNGPFVFSSVTYTSLVRTALSCDLGQCTDALQFRITGTVDDGPGGFDPTLFTGVFTANGGCVESDTVAGTCNGQSSASWSITLVALGRNTAPEPGSLALVGVALAGLGFFGRRAKS